MGFFIKSAFVLSVAVFCNFFINKLDEDSIKGKKVFITGASQNIGEETAYQYAKLGADIVITARREAELKKVVAKCLDFGAKRASYLVGDMSDTGVYESIVANAVERLGGTIDIFVLNHVISRHGRWVGDKEDLKFLNQSFPINYISFVRLATAALPHLDKSNGQLIVLASAAGVLGLPNIAAYGGTKSAIINFFTSLQIERMMYGDNAASITICILGAIDTERAKWILTKERMQITPHPMKNTVADMIEGGAARRRYVYTPYTMRFVALLREISPSLFDRILLLFLFGK